MVRNQVSDDGSASRRETPAGLAAEAWIEYPEKPLSATGSGALDGLLFAVKDNIDVAGIPTTAGCPAFGYTPTTDAIAVQRLRRAGASLAGKTNLDQFACGLNGSRSPYGAVPSAFDAIYVSGGSSSGSAYVVATGQVDFALGTDTAGSGRIPAGFNNIVGLKPSRGLVSARGVVPAAQSVDCVSILARTVALAVKALDALIEFDPLDPYSRRLSLRRHSLPARFRFGVPSVLEFFGDSASQAAFAGAVGRLKELGGQPVAIDYAPLAEAASLLYDSALVAERYAAVRDFFDANEDQVIEPVRTILASGRRYSAADLCLAQTLVRAHRQRAAVMWQDIDVLLVPTAPTQYTIAQMRRDPLELNRRLGTYTNFVNLLDYAAIAVPSSIRADGLPFGITLIGPCGSDWQLAELGQRYHHATGLTQGATGEPLPDMELLSVLRSSDKAPDAGTLAVAVVGAHLSGMPLNGQLTERGAVLRRATQTAPRYRLYALPGTTPPRPGLKRCADGGRRIAVEVWDMPIESIGGFLALIPPPLGLGSVELVDGSWVHGFVCEGHALERAQDVSAHGGWRAYLSSLQTASNA